MNSNMMSHITWREFERRVVVNGDVVLLPVGALEQHGWHLPLGVDWMLANEVALRVATRVNGVVAPPVCYGARSQLRSGGGEHRVGTTGVRGATLIQNVLDILVSLARKGAKKIVVIDGHYENGPFLNECCEQAVDALTTLGVEGCRIMKIMYGEDFPDALLREVYGDRPSPGMALEHAALLETSMMMYCFPELVGDPEYAGQVIAAFPAYDNFPPTESWVPASGALAPAFGATADKGAKLVEHFVSAVADAIRRELLTAKGS